MSTILTFVILSADRQNKQTLQLLFGEDLRHDLLLGELTDCCECELNGFLAATNLITVIVWQQGTIITAKTVLSSEEME